MSVFWEKILKFLSENQKIIATENLRKCSEKHSTANIFPEIFRVEIFRLSEIFHSESSPATVQAYDFSIIIWTQLIKCKFQAKNRKLQSRGPKVYASSILKKWPGKVWVVGSCRNAMCVIDIHEHRLPFWDLFLG